MSEPKFASLPDEFARLTQQRDELQDAIERKDAAIAELVQILKACGGVLAGETLNKSSLTNTLERTRDAIAKYDIPKDKP